jgi:branched-chain amino acid transport system permease protein
MAVSCPLLSPLVLAWFPTLQTRRPCPVSPILEFIQQIINGLTLGSIYALIAIGYTMVYGIIGMINFAHGEIYMIGAYVGLLTITALGLFGVDSISLILLATLAISILVTGSYGWIVERLAYRPLRGSPRLVPLISAIGVSIFLQNYVQLGQGARDVSMQPVLIGGWRFGPGRRFSGLFVLHAGADRRDHGGVR